MPKRSSKTEGSEDVNNIAPHALGDTFGGIVPEQPPIKNQAAVELGRLGGLRGGRARALKLEPEKRREIARLAAVARWSKVHISKEKKHE
jgi:hypothetical protein